ncbi:MAG TPA: hypothetical protein PLO77_04890 [Thermoclostridium caenicola]|nr:hypothetical protein [Thermoclostridium caenicola]
MHELWNTYRKPILVLLLAFAFTVGLLVIYHHTSTTYVMGALLHPGMPVAETLNGNLTAADVDDNEAERFHRPSGSPALNTKYSFPDLQNVRETVPVFKNPEDIIKAYYGLLREASNMTGYHGGCGTVGFHHEPYPYAWKLLTDDYRKALPLEKFIDSFKGTGHTTLLKLLPAWAPPETPDNIRYYMVEIEVITGPKITDENKDKPQPGYFAYYYGLVTVEDTGRDGWKIKRIDYIPEDFLCAPYHSWYWDAPALVEIVYGNLYGLVDRIDSIDRHDSLFMVYAVGNGQLYRFDFVRLTNGEDILLRENVKFAGVWKETNLLRDSEQIYKLSVLNPRLQ